MIDRISEISEQIEDLRNLSDGYMLGGYRNIGNKLKEAADTIESLSEKLQATNTMKSDRLRGEGTIDL